MMSPSEQIALWADRLRDLSALGLRYARDAYDRERYSTLQTLAMEMMAMATGQAVESLEPLRGPIFSRPSPLVAGAAAIIDTAGRVLLARRSDNRLWNMPGGLFEVGETPAAAVVREVREETGLCCEPVALVGVYDSRLWDRPPAHPVVSGANGFAGDKELHAGHAGQHLYKFTFLCRLAEGQPIDEAPSHAHETLEMRWFAEEALPADLFPGHLRRIRDAYRVWRGDPRPHFDP